MYTAILERTREIGILKSLGASKSYIVTIVVRETVMICLVGILVGTGLGYLGRSAVESKFPLVTVLILPEWVFWSAVLAVFGAVLGAFYPALKAARQDPIEALAYE
jgi:putative ABC transport system permease protein